tara:strand:- start:4213 stop:5496 length:1284 start_codon:yes stop_codon:yes gene_type:complete
MAEEYKVKLKFVPDTSSLKKSLGSLGNIGVGGFGKGAGGLGALPKSLFKIVGFLAILGPIFKVLSLILRPIKDILYVALLPLLYLFRPIGIFFQTVLRPYLQKALVAQRMGLIAQAEGKPGLATANFLKSARIIGSGFIDLIVQSLAGFSQMVLNALGFTELATAIGNSAKEFSKNLLDEIDLSLGRSVEDLLASGAIDNATANMLGGVIASLQGGVETMDFSPVTGAMSHKFEEFNQEIIKDIDKLKLVTEVASLGLFGAAALLILSLAKSFIGKLWQGGKKLLGFGGKKAGKQILKKGASKVGLGLIGGPAAAVALTILTAAEAFNFFMNRQKESDEATKTSSELMSQVYGTVIPEALSVTDNAFLNTGYLIGQVFETQIPKSIGVTKASLYNVSSEFQSMDGKEINWYINIIRRYISRRSVFSA